jgi:hypothetical protein
MRAHRRLSGVVWAIVVALACGCSASSGKPTMTGTGGQTGAPGVACLDSPTDLPRPPTSGLPCELIPPGLRLN